MGNRCIESIEEFSEEIIIIDTGSTDGNLKIKHDGYEEKVMNEKLKLKRNIKLLYKAIEDDPKSLRWRFFLSRELIFFNEKNKIIKEIRETSKQLFFVFEIKETNYLSVTRNGKELYEKEVEKVEKMFQ